MCACETDRAEHSMLILSICKWCIWKLWIVASLFVPLLGDISRCNVPRWTPLWSAQMRMRSILGGRPWICKMARRISMDTLPRWCKLPVATLQRQTSERFNGIYVINEMRHTNTCHRNKSYFDWDKIGVYCVDECNCAIIQLILLIRVI